MNYLIYRITFFKSDIGSNDWAELFKTLFKSVNKVNLVVLFEGIKIDFFIIADKKLDVLNSHLFPFYLADDVGQGEMDLINQKADRMSLLPMFYQDNLIRSVEKEKLKSNQLVKIEIKLKKYDLLKGVLGGKMDYRGENGQLKSVRGIWLVHLYQFLAFELSKSINSEISRVKPVLAASKLATKFEDEGILELKNVTDKKLGVTSFDFDRHSLVLGQSGSGKSIFIKLLIEDIHRRWANNFGVVLLDPHGSLDGLIGAEVGPKVSINFKTVQTNLFVNVGKAVLSTELTMDLFSTVLDLKQNQNLVRVLKYSLNTLFGVNKMDLENLKKLLTDSVWRKELLKEVSDRNNLNFFETEYQTLQTSQYAVAVLPILNLISELDFIKQVNEKVDLTKMLNENFLTSFPVKLSDFGTTITRIIGGSIIQQVFTIMQSGLVNKKIILIVDELAIIQTPSLVQILAEARKFGLTIILAQQYLTQVKAEILQSIFANVVNYFCFKLSRDDAEIVARNINLEVDEYFLKNKNDPREVQELGTKILTDLNPQEVVCRIMAGSQYMTPFKSKTVKVNI